MIKTRLKKVLSGAFIFLFTFGILNLDLEKVRGQSRIHWAEFPREFLDTSKPNSQDGIIFQVQPSDNLQSILDQAQLGDQIILPSGATFKGHFVIRGQAEPKTKIRIKPKPNLQKWLLIRSSLSNELPEGKRVSPEQAPKMAKIQPLDGGFALEFSPSFGSNLKAHHIRLEGIEILPNSQTGFNSGLIQLGENSNNQTTLEQIPDHIIFDRCYIHGLEGEDDLRGFFINSSHTGILNSYISNFKKVGQESQAILIANTFGIIKIENNYVEGAGENLMSGGLDLKIPNIVPSDVQISNNWFNKPLKWNPLDPSFENRHWSVKNLFEIKTGQRWLIQGNIFENCWVDGQIGFAIQLTPRNQEGFNTWSRVQDIILDSNLIRNVAGGLNILGEDDANLSEKAMRIEIENNQWLGVGGPRLGFNGRLVQILGPAEKIIYRGNQSLSPNLQVLLSLDSGPMFDLLFVGNQLEHGVYGVHSPFGEGSSGLNESVIRWDFSYNTITGMQGFERLYPLNNTYLP